MLHPHQNIDPCQFFRPVPKLYGPTRPTRQAKLLLTHFKKGPMTNEKTYYSIPKIFLRQKNSFHVATILS